MYFTYTLNISFFYFTLTIWTVLSTYILHVQYLWKEDVAIGNLKNSDKYMWRIRFTAREGLLFCTCTCILFTNSLNSFLMYYVYFRSLVLFVKKKPSASMINFFNWPVIYFTSKVMPHQRQRLNLRSVKLFVLRMHD